MHLLLVPVYDPVCLTCALIIHSHPTFPYRWAVSFPFAQVNRLLTFYMANKCPHPFASKIKDVFPRCPTCISLFHIEFLCLRCFHVWFPSLLASLTHIKSKVTKRMRILQRNVFEALHLTSSGFICIFFSLNHPELNITLQIWEHSRPLTDMDCHFPLRPDLLLATE